LGYRPLAGLAVASAIALVACGDINQGADEGQSGALATENDTNNFGTLEVFSTTGNIDRGNAFFQNLGTNGRTCNSCHLLRDGMGINTAAIKSIFTNTQGNDPLFRTNDGSNAPKGTFANTSTLAAKQKSFSMLLNHGTIRVGIGMPATADFTTATIKDPYGFASTTEFSLFRRPLPDGNVAFNTLAMWDGRESEGRPAIRDALKNQANDATLGHAAAAKPLTDAQQSSIADFQLALFVGQVSSNVGNPLVGSLTVPGCTTSMAADSLGQPCEAARGGGQALAKVFSMGNDDFPKFAPGINDPLAAGFNNVSFVIYDPFESDELGPAPKINGKTVNAVITKNRGEIGDGENLFYTKPITITNVPGLTDLPDGPTTIMGTCTTCHNTPDVGNHSLPRFFNTGVSDVAGASSLFTADYPVYTFKQTSTGKTVSTSDPGLALRTGKFADIGKFKTPQLRTLGNRAPYFHNGQANTLQDVLNFYNKRFNIGFTAEEMRKIIVFLNQT
jgi:cytochrome c peroxidase